MNCVSRIVIDIDFCVLILLMLFYQNTLHFKHQSVLFFHSSQKFLLLAGGTLKISEVTEDDAGVYTCIADNGNETVEAQADLTVQGM